MNTNGHYSLFSSYLHWSTDLQVVRQNVLIFPGDGDDLLLKWTLNVSVANVIQMDDENFTTKLPNSEDETLLEFFRTHVHIQSAKDVPLITAKILSVNTKKIYKCGGLWLSHFGLCSLQSALSIFCT